MCTHPPHGRLIGVSRVRTLSGAQGSVSVRGSCSRGGVQGSPSLPSPAAEVSPRLCWGHPVGSEEGCSGWLLPLRWLPQWGQKRQHPQPPASPAGDLTHSPSLATWASVLCVVGTWDLTPGECRCSRQLQFRSGIRGTAWRSALCGPRPLRLHSKQTAQWLSVPRGSSSWAQRSRL